MGLEKYVGIKDYEIRKKLSSVLVREGCESWSELIQLPELIGDTEDSIESVRTFLYENSIPAISAGKLINFIRSNKNSRTNSAI
jgi:hypothetical protein